VGEKEGEGALPPGKETERRGRHCANRNRRNKKNPMCNNGGGLTGEDDLTEAEDKFVD
jgi:hypothetical protein